MRFKQFFWLLLLKLLSGLPDSLFVIVLVREGVLRDAFRVVMRSLSGCFVAVGDEREEVAVDELRMVDVFIKQLLVDGFLLGRVAVSKRCTVLLAAFVLVVVA